MRLVVATLLLLIQLRPLAAGVVCLEQTLGREECAMPAHADGLSQPGEPTTAPHTCPDNMLCSPAGAAVLQSALSLPAPGGPVALRPALIPESPGGPALIPPFHPPRA
jgi:hypothetical protein